MFELLFEMFSYPFLQRAAIVGLLVSVCAALLGSSLVLKRFSMIGDGLSHVGFGSLAIASALNAAPLAVALPVVVLAAFFLLRLTENSQIRGDAAIALISTGALAVGVTVISLSTGFNVDVNNYLFGSILAIKSSDVVLSCIISALVFVLYIVCHHKIFAITFDENFARATGVHARAYSLLVALLTAVVVVLGMRLMGALLISALIIFPALTSMRLAKSFLAVTLCSVGVAIVCFFVGLCLSFAGGLPTGSTVVLVHIAAFVVFWLARLVKKRGL